MKLFLKAAVTISSVLSLGAFASYVEQTSRLEGFRPDRPLFEEILHLEEGYDQPIERRQPWTRRRILTYHWNQTVPGGAIAYNISMDISGCGRSVELSDRAGIYTSANGVISNRATTGGISKDLKSMRRSVLDLDMAERLFANHTLALVELVERQNNALLDGKLICKDRTQPPSSTDIIAVSRLCC